MEFIIPDYAVYTGLRMEELMLLGDMQCPGRVGSYPLGRGGDTKARFRGPTLFLCLVVCEGRTG